MTKIKLCGLTRPCDISAVNELLPDYIGFVFAKKSRRFVSFEQAKALREQLDKRITPVGVFVNENIETVAQLVNSGVIDVAQLHGNEDEGYIEKLRKLTDCRIIKAFSLKEQNDIDEANRSSADYVLLDSVGGGTGNTFDWSLLNGINRPYFLAGGLTAENVKTAVSKLAPFGVDASSSLETDGFKDKIKMTAFVDAVRNGKD